MFEEQRFINGILGKFKEEIDLITPQKHDSREKVLFIADWNQKKL